MQIISDQLFKLMLTTYISASFQCKIVGPCYFQFFAYHIILVVGSHMNIFEARSVSNETVAMRQ